MRQGREGNNGGEGVAPTSAKFEPVTKITWQDIIVWSNAYSKMRGYKEAYYSDSGLTTAITNVGEPNIANPYVDWNATGYRLPTEGEWQYAASYKDGTDWTPYNYASGATAAYTDATATGLVAWYSANSGTTPANRSTQPVGTLKPNALGLHDMSGNVWEWCWDWSGTLPATTQTDYRGPVSGTARILRGGSHYDSEVSIGYRWPKASNNEVMSYPVNVFHQGGLRLAQKQ